MSKGPHKQKKLLTILQSGGSNPLSSWDIQVKNGWTRRVKDDDMGNIVFEIAGTNVATAYIVAPPDPRASLGITLPFITMHLKNLKRNFTFEIQILDDKKMRRRFRFSNYQSSTKVGMFSCGLPLALKPGWNQIQLNLATFTLRAYGTNYLETQRVQLHANCRLRRVFFSDHLYPEEELPKEYRIHVHVRQAQQPQKPSPQPSIKKVSEVLSISMKAQPSGMIRLSKDGTSAPQVSSETIVAETSYKGSLNESASGEKLSEKQVTILSGGTMELTKVESKQSLFSPQQTKLGARKSVIFALENLNNIEDSISQDSHSMEKEEALEEVPVEKVSSETELHLSKKSEEEFETDTETDTPRTDTLDSDFSEIPGSDTEDIIQLTPMENIDDSPPEMTETEDEQQAQ